MPGLHLRAPKNRYNTIDKSFDGASDAIVYPDDSGLFYLYYPRCDDPKVSRKDKLNRLTEVVIHEQLGEKIDRPVCDEKKRREL